MANDGSLVANKPRSGLNSGLDVLEALSRHRHLTLTEISREIAMTKSGVHALLAILLERSFVERTEEGAYRLGVRAWQVGCQTMPLELGRLAHPIMARLTAEIDEGSVLGALAGFGVVYLNRVESEQPVRVHADVGMRIPAHCTSTGLALLAAQPADRIEALLPAELRPMTPHTITDRGALLAELDRIRARGYAINRGGWRIDVGGIAVSILDGRDQALAALCVAAPLYRMNKAWFARVVPATIAASGALSAAFGRGLALGHEAQT